LSNDKQYIVEYIAKIKFSLQWKKMNQGIVLHAGGTIYDKPRVAGFVWRA